MKHFASKQTKQPANPRHDTSRHNTGLVLQYRSTHAIRNARPLAVTADPARPGRA